MVQNVSFKYSDNAVSTVNIVVIIKSCKSWLFHPVKINDIIYQVFFNKS